jgi:hypothetical protein
MDARPTPETDKEAMPFNVAQMHLPPPTCEIVTAKFARKLERERDEAMRALRLILPKLIKAEDALRELGAEEPNLESSILTAQDVLKLAKPKGGEE